MAKPSTHSTEHPELKRIGSAIRAKRKGLGLAQEALAHAAGIDRSYMGGIERGEHNVALVNLVKISAALGVTVAELMNEANL